jgi:hypothetical protein
VPFPVPDSYSSSASDIAREESKRTASPPSFFFSRSRSQVLAATYFTDERLAGGYSAVAAKHRQRIQSATFGQMMAAFEWCIKDYFAQVIDATDLFDDRVESAKWILLEKSRVLAQREATGSIGAILIHPTQGWHDTANLQGRYSEFFAASPLSNAEADTLERLWILRHSVAHNAGFVTNHDAYRMRSPALSERSVRIDETFLNDAFGFLTGIVRRLGDPVGQAIMTRWLAEKSTGNFADDVLAYQSLKHITTVVESRNIGLPSIDEATYDADRQAQSL